MPIGVHQSRRTPSLGFDLAFVYPSETASHSPVERIPRWRNSGYFIRGKADRLGNLCRGLIRRAIDDAKAQIEDELEILDAARR